MQGVQKSAGWYRRVLYDGVPALYDLVRISMEKEEVQTRNMVTSVRKIWSRSWCNILNCIHLVPVAGRLAVLTMYHAVCKEFSALLFM